MERHEKIDYVEFSTPDMETSKAFFTQVFGWNFTDYGPDYSDCPDGGIMTGFFLRATKFPLRKPAEL